MKISKYRDRFKNPEFGRIFIGFKNYILDEEIDSAKKCASIILPHLEKSPLDLLELGAGEGSVSLGLLKEISKTHSINEYTAIDINSDFVNLLEKKRKQFKKFSQRVNFESSDARTYRLRKNYDAILSLNSFYGMPFKGILKFVSHLKTNGLIGILLNCEDSLTLDLTRKFVESMVSVEDLIKWLERQNIQYKTFNLMSNVLSKKDFVLQKELNPSAEFVYRYLLRRVHEPLDEIFKYVSKKPEKYFKIPQKLILIFK